MAEAKIDQLIKEANDFLAKGDIDKAISAFKEALKLDPDNLSIRYNIATCFFKQEKFSEAIKDFLDIAKWCKKNNNLQEAAKIYKDFLSFDAANPQSVLIDKEIIKAASDTIKKCIDENLIEILVNLGKIFLESEEMSSAIDLFSKAVKIKSQDPELHKVLGLAYFKKKDFKSAQGEFQEIIRLLPKGDAFAYQMLGAVSAELKDSVSNVINHYQKAIDLYLANNQFNESIEICQKILKIAPQNTEVLYKLGSIYYKAQNKQEASKVYDKLITIFTQKGQLDKAILVYEKMLEAEPANQEVIKKLNQIYEQILTKDPSNLTARHKLIENLLTIGETHKALPEFLSLANTYLKNNMPEESSNICKKVLQLDPNYADAHKILGEIFYQKGQMQESLEEFLKAANFFKEQNNLAKSEEISLILKERFPEEKESRLQVAFSYLHKGKLEEAQKVIDKNLEETPKDIASLKLLAEIFQKRNELESVITTYQKILQIDPNQTEIRNKLIEGYLNLGQLADAIKESTYLGDIFTQQKKYKEAEVLYRNILSFFPAEVEIHHHLGELYLEKGDAWKATEELLLLMNYYLRSDSELQALEICRKIIKIAPENFNARYQLAKLARKTSLQDEAVAQYSFLADLLIKNQLIQRAEEVILELLEVSPLLTDYRQKLIDLFIKQENIDLAKSHYKVLIEDFLKANNLDQAKKTAKNLASLEEDNLSLKSKISDIFLEAGFFEEALNILEEVLGSYETRKDLTSCLQITPQIFKLLKELGYFERYWNLRQKIAFWYKDLGQLEKSAEEIYQVLEGRLRGDFAAGVQDILKNLILWQSDKMPALQERLYNLAISLNKDKLIKSALIIFETLEPIYSKDENLQKSLEVLDKISAIYIQFNQPEEALKSLEKKLEIYSKSGKSDEMIEVLFNQIEILSSERNLKKQKEIYQKIINIAENDHIRMRMGSIYFEQGFYQEAQPLYRQILEKDTKNIEAMTRLAIINIKLGNLDQAKLLAKQLFSKGRVHLIIQEYKKALQSEFDVITTHLNLGIFFKEMGFIQDAIDEFKKVLKDKDKMILGGDLIGDSLKEQGFIDLAIRQYQKVLSLPGFKEEDYLETRYKLAQLYEQTKKYKDALAHYQECYAIDIRYKDVVKKVEELSEIVSKNRES